MSDQIPDELNSDLFGELRSSLAELSSAPLSEESLNILNRTNQALDELIQDVLSTQENLIQDLQKAHQERNKFVSVVTHELRLPLTSIKGYTDLLRQGLVGPLNTQQLSFLDTIRNNVDRMSALLSDLSDLSRLDTGRLNLEIGSLLLKDQINTALEGIKYIIEQKEQGVETHLPDQLPRVSADPERLVQVLTNLIRNASMYTPNGGTIRLRAFQDNGQVCLEVEDNGIGISPEDQSQLFNPFFRSEDATVREQHGWGLGLHVSGRLIQLMGGSIGLRSRLGSGSTFWFTLPVDNT